ncbi:MAG TPA: hypothetical protein PKJ91_00275 [Methanoregulaceae archaeon]|nr:hypothetical protein [Methanoregulaceae archaeon]
MRQPEGVFRGGLLSRWREAPRLGCSFVEIPANFIKHPKEEEATGLGMCQMLTDEAIYHLYTPTDKIPQDLRYILHTEPSFAHQDANGVKHPAADLQWHNSSWVKKFCDMLIGISERLGMQASVIEIHPGSNRAVMMRDIAVAMKNIQEIYGGHFGDGYPKVVLENRNVSNIEEGRQLREFWMALQNHTPEICDTCGIVLDLSVLFNVARRKGDSYEAYLDAVPAEGVKGIHVHTLHGAPSLEDAVPWSIAFEKVKAIPHDFFINPEIHHPNRVGQTIAFCEDMLNK